MGNDNVLPLSKKRSAGREISRDSPGLDDEEDVSEQETGTFKRASDEVLAGRRIVKVHRQPASSALPASTSNPFAEIRLVPPVSTIAPDETKNELQDRVEKKAVDKEDKKDEPSKVTDEEHKLNEKELEEKAVKAVVESDEDREKVDIVEKAADEGTSVGKGKDDQRLIKETEAMPVEERSLNTNIKAKDDPKPADDQEKIDGDNALNGDKKEDDKEGKKDNNNSDTGPEIAPLSSFQQLSSSKNAFTGLAGTGFSSSAFSFGSISKDKSLSGTAFAFGSKTDHPSLPSFSFDTSNNGSTPLFSSTGASGNKSEGAAFPSMQEVHVETGEEDEETVFTADSALFEFSEGGWKERGKGEVKVNVSNTHKARLVMRARGNYRLILNANLYPDMKLTKMDKKGITFACVNSAAEGKIGLATFALKFKDVSIVEAFSATVSAHNGEARKAAPSLKTPENSPKTAEE